MLSLTAEPLNLVQGSLISAKLRAKNQIGWGFFSEPNIIG